MVLVKSFALVCLFVVCERLVKFVWESLGDKDN